VVRVGGGDLMWTFKMTESLSGGGSAWSLGRQARRRPGGRRAQLRPGGDGSTGDEIHRGEIVTPHVSNPHD
jgi:hypothetical protein